MFGASSGAAVPSDDPYANIDIDLTKITVPKIAKPFEQKTEEEKQEDALKRKDSDVKSNLKTTS